MFQKGYQKGYELHDIVNEGQNNSVILHVKIGVSTSHGVNKKGVASVVTEEKDNDDRLGPYTYNRGTVSSITQSLMVPTLSGGIGASLPRIGIASACAVVVATGVLVSPILRPRIIPYPWDQPTSKEKSRNEAQMTVVLAGSYNPPHSGHLAMLSYLSQRYVRQLMFSETFVGLCSAGKPPCLSTHDFPIAG